jgi:hypothetical protein
LGQGPLGCDAQVILMLSDLLLSSKRYGKSSLSEVSMPCLKKKWLSSLFTVYEFDRRLWKESRREVQSKGKNKVNNKRKRQRDGFGLKCVVRHITNGRPAVYIDFQIKAVQSTKRNRVAPIPELWLAESEIAVLL